MFSVVIPTYNEEKYLPKLLKSINSQKMKPSEVIIADADSTDKTRDIAKSFGCKIVKGGRIAVGRNRGAEKAKEEIIVFLDADTVLHRYDFFNKIIGKFLSEDADVASCFFTPSDKRLKYGIPMAGMNAVKYITHKLKLHTVIGGAVIITTKKAFNKLHGFNERMKAHEDNNYFRRAVKKGMRFIIIRTTARTSTRRFEKKGLRKILILGVLGAAVGIIGTSWMKRKMKKADEGFWDDVK